jgi:uncharacterized protein YhaN
MRFDHLELIRYGHFTDRSIDLPSASQDFHLIIGPNEAGKSTLLAAIQDLLFGIPVQSPMGFVHVLSDLRLGAAISDKDGTLRFHRAKAQKQTLRTPEDAVLDPGTLAAYLGTADRAFFEQMFGLDHDKLVEGGQSILSAEGDVGQILFQSAAGIAGLGKVRDALIEEAETLWAPRKSSNRAYYAAAERFEQAATEVKNASVRTKVWADASGLVSNLEEAIAKDNKTHRELVSRRALLERIRRVAPFVQTLRESEARLHDLGNVIELQPDSSNVLAETERALSTAVELSKVRNDAIRVASEELAQIQVDEAILATVEEITALDEKRSQYSAYLGDIERRQKEVSALWEEAKLSCNQLKWQHDSEKSVQAQLPSQLDRKDLGRLAREYSGIAQAVAASAKAERDKRSELESLESRINGLEKRNVPASLGTALKTARSLGDENALISSQRSAVSKAKLKLDTALLAIAMKAEDIPGVVAMQPPDQKTISRLVQEQLQRATELNSIQRQVTGQFAKINKIKLDIAQFREKFHPTTKEAVLVVRGERNQSWGALKAGQTAFNEGALRFEQIMLRADDVSDTRLEDVEEAAELQSKNQELDREQLSLQSLEVELNSLQEGITNSETAWNQRLATLGLPQMALDDISTWVTRRQDVLDAANVLAEAEDSQNSQVSAIKDARNALAQAMSGIGLEVPPDGTLASYCSQAEEFIQTAESVGTLRESLGSQIAEGKRAISGLEAASKQSRGALETWSADWTAALKKASLPAACSIEVAGRALELIEAIEEKLLNMRQIQTQRIQTMQADLDEFARTAATLAQEVAPDIKDAIPEQIARQLLVRLTKARTEKNARDRLEKELKTAQAALADINQTVLKANATIKPLMERTGSATTVELANAVARSDSHRLITAEINKAMHLLLEAGDGLSRAQLEEEASETNLAQLGPDLDRHNREIDTVFARLNELSGQLANASAALSKIGGSDAAAIAEAKRQEALAAMANAAERYIKVAAAGRLLKWSIDQYREEKQGPMLKRASAIFATLTAGSFQQLIVDFDMKPMGLLGIRSGSPVSRVDIVGMSKGTRDQLYMALRLAALELHLEQSHPLPFIADDLFINYDDKRAIAGLRALAALSERTQVIFLSHHDHLVPMVREVFGKNVNVVSL